MLVNHKVRVGRNLRVSVLVELVVKVWLVFVAVEEGLVALKLLLTFVERVV